MSNGLYGRKFNSKWPVSEVGRRLEAIADELLAEQEEDKKCCK